MFQAVRKNKAEREREREREKQKERERNLFPNDFQYLLTRSFV